MANPEVPERSRFMLERKGLVAIGKRPVAEVRAAIRRPIQTFQQAARLFDAVAERLGDRAIVDAWGPNSFDRALYVRDRERPQFLVASPLLDVRTVDRRVLDLPVRVLGPDGGVRETKPAAPPRERPKLDIAPSGPLARSGDLTIRTGSGFLMVSYDERGVAFEGTEGGGDTFTWGYFPETMPHMRDPFAHPPQEAPLDLMTFMDPGGDAWSLDDLAGFIAALDPAARVPLRLHMPTELPAGGWGICHRALGPLALAVRDDVACGAGAGVAVVDAFSGVARATGPTWDSALEAFRRELFRQRPRPPEEAAQPKLPPPPPPDDDGPTERVDADGKVIGVSTGTIVLQGGGGGGRVIPWPAATPDTTPALATSFGPLPSEVPERFAAIGFSRWTRTVDAMGRVHSVLVREDARGSVAIGEGVLELCDPATLDADLARAVASERAQAAKLREQMGDFPNAWEDNRYANCTMTLAVWHERERRPMRPMVDQMRFEGEGGQTPWGGYCISHRIGWSMPLR